jgi:hypothetical protein
MKKSPFRKKRSIKKNLTSSINSSISRAFLMRGLGVAQVVEHLLSKFETLSSNLRTA